MTNEVLGREPRYGICVVTALSEYTYPQAYGHDDDVPPATETTSLQREVYWWSGPDSGHATPHDWAVDRIHKLGDLVVEVAFGVVDLPADDAFLHAFLDDPFESDEVAEQAFIDDIEREDDDSQWTDDDLANYLPGPEPVVVDGEPAWQYSFQNVRGWLVGGAWTREDVWRLDAASGQTSFFFDPVGQRSRERPVHRGRKLGRRVALDRVELIQALAELRREGFITEEEFNAKKVLLERL